MPDHQCYFLDTGVQIGAWGSRDVLMTAEDTIDPNVVSQRVRDQYFPIRLRIAEGAAWLLQNPMGGSGQLGHRERYLSLFFQRGACTYSGGFNSSFFEEVREFYSDDFLESIHCPLRRTDNWAQRLVRQEGKTQHPLYHLLLVNFLGLTIQQFFDLPANRLAFGEGPWPCLNTACRHFGEALITTYETSATQRNGRTPRGTFRCGCGFAYSRIGPESSKEERYHLDRYVTFGDEWDSCVRDLFHSGKYTRRALAQELQMAQNTLDRELVRLGLITQQTRLITSDARRKPITPQIAAELREKNRKLYLEAAKAQPSRTAIRRASPAADSWLRKNDQEWWEANAPSRIFTKPTAYVDWQDRDSKWASAVLAEAQRIYSFSGRPVLVCKTGIARTLKITDVLMKRADKVPLTIKTLKEVCEDRESHAVRRVRWAVHYFEERGICPSQSELGTKAAVTGRTAKMAKVVRELAAAMAQFHPQLGLHYDAAA